VSYVNELGSWVSKFPVTEHSQRAIDEACAEVDRLRAQLLGLEEKTNRLETALKRIIDYIPTDRNERTGARGTFHEEQPDSPGGFLEADLDELIDEIADRCQAALVSSNPTPT
jgi:hypothetical protein